MGELELNFKPKWIIIVGPVIGVLLGLIIIFAGYEAKEDFLLRGISVMVFVAVISAIVYYLISRAVKDRESETGLDMMGFFDMDTGSTTGGVAEVMSVETTGEYVNNQPEFILLLRITASGQDSFEVEHKQALSDESAVAVGAKIPVTYDKNRNVKLVGLGDIGQYKVIDPKNF
jgi:hypothetical protein